jgi:hypothetical protein
MCISIPPYTSGRCSVLICILMFPRTLAYGSVCMFVWHAARLSSILCSVLKTGMHDIGIALRRSVWRDLWTLWIRRAPLPLSHPILGKQWP